MTKNASYTREYLQHIASYDGDAAGRRHARTAMEASTAIYHGWVVASCFVPRLFDVATRKRMTEIAETAYRILVKVMREYLQNPEYRKVFDYDPRLVDLILLPRDYEDILPFARVDAFIDEDSLDVQFCEFNGDGSSGMNENREITASIRDTASYKAFASSHALQDCNDELFTGWVDEFIRIYKGYAYANEHPHFAIVDFLESAITDEFKIFANLFAERGIECSVYDVRDLRFDGEHLIGTKAFYGRDNAPIDAAWRRCVTNDIIENWEASQPLIEAVRAHKLALIGSFAGHIVHDKQIFQVLFKPETQALLTDEENAFVRETVPFTCFLDEDEIDLAEVVRTREAWIIKPTDAYGSKDVFAGKDFDDAAWKHIVDEHANGRAGAPFIVQRFCTPYKTLTFPLYGEEADYTRTQAVAFNNLSGLFVYNGRFTGVFSRLGPEPVISKKTRGVTAATLWVDDEAK